MGGTRGQICTLTGRHFLWEVDCPGLSVVIIPLKNAWVLLLQPLERLLIALGPNLRVFEKTVARLLAVGEHI